ncbi:MAG TPA: CHASE2 domain-containing protein [Ohtaekwangia sp.]
MKRLLVDSVIATFFVFGVLIGIREVSQLNVLNVFDPLGQSLGDMEITDITFSQLRVEIPPVDTNIVIVNTGYLSRAEVAQQIRVISQFKPKVIGIDIFFNCRDGKTDSFNCPLAYDTLSNLILGTAIQDAGNVVMVTKLLQSEKLVKQYGDIDKYDSLEHTDEIIRGTANEGYASLETGADHQEDLKTCRRFNPAMRLEDGSTEYAFSTRIAMLYDSLKTSRFLARGKRSEVINFRGNVPDVYEASAKEFANRYTYLETYQALDPTSFEPEMIRDKIVLFGFMGQDMDDTSWDDKFITPLNKKFAGKTRPDMYGIVLHANIISMILNEDYVNELEEWQQIAIAFILCFLNVILFFFITEKIPHWFDGLSLLIQLVQIVICTWLMMYVLDWFNFKLNLTYSLAAIALVGTCFELYLNVVKRLYMAIKRKGWFTKKSKQVLTD